MTRDCLQLIAATSWFWVFSLGFLLSIIVSVWITCCTSYWWLLLVYLFWIYHDKNISEKGGRRINWVRNWGWWRHMKSYFNFKLIPEKGCKLNPKNNYLFACFPHGTLPIGPFASFIQDSENAFPEHTAYNTALNIQFFLPFIRELFLATGFVSISAASLKHILLKPGGNIITLLIGGADEIQYSQPEKYKIILKKRKGFVKMALQTGTGLVPVISFGETNVFHPFKFPGFDFVRGLIKRTTQIDIVVPIGKYLICPNKVPINTVVGKPIEVEKTENPTVEQIDSLHETFMDNLTKLFEEHKQDYVKEPSSTFLEVV